MTVIENKKNWWEFPSKGAQSEKMTVTLFELCEYHLVPKKNQNLLFQNDSFFKLQKLIIINFFNNYEQSEFYFRKKAQLWETKD